DECQRSRRESRGQRSQQEERYPDATRESPTEGASARMGRRLNQINDAMGEDDYDTVLEIANEIQSESRANDYDKAFAANMAGHASFNKDDTEAAKRYIAQAIEYDALDNTNHFQAILMLAQLHAQDEESDQALALLDRYFSESASREPNELILRGQVLYQAERYEDAIPALREAFEASDEPHNSWTQTLLAAYAESGREAEAIALAVEIAANSP